TNMEYNTMTVISPTICPSGAVPVVTSSGHLSSATDITVIAGFCSTTTATAHTSSATSHPATGPQIFQATLEGTVIGTATQTIPSSSSRAIDLVFARGICCAFGAIMVWAILMI
ncbi:hypothetical protein FRC20_004636, partial [Serendipita sp. 405]